MLAKRLIHTLSVSMDAEEGMISRLKVSCHNIALTASYAKFVPGNRTRVIWQRGRRRRRGKRAPARFSRQFSQSLHIFILELVNRPLNDIHLRLGGSEGGGGALCHSTTSPPTVHNHTPNPRPNCHFCRSLCNFSCRFCPIWCAKQTWPTILN